MRTEAVLSSPLQANFPSIFAQGGKERVLARAWNATILINFLLRHVDFFVCFPRNAERVRF